MKRQSDHKHVGTITVVRANDWSFTKDDGSRRVNPVRVDSILVTVTNLENEIVGYAVIPMDQLPPVI